MVFTVAQVVNNVTKFITLMPGDIIATGTPPAVGLGMNPPRFLRAGDRMRLGIQGLGEQSQDGAGVRHGNTAVTALACSSSLHICPYATHNRFWIQLGSV